jgi:chromosome segregation ATPase
MWIKICIVQPNMHAAERYDGVVDKLRECNEQLEGTKEAVRELALRFEEVKKRRQQLFQVRVVALFLRSSFRV